MVSYAINRKTFAVVKFNNGREASKASGKDDILIHGPEDMSKLTPGELNGLYKRTKSSPTQSFSDRGKMCQWLYDRLDGLSTQGESRVKETPQEVPMAAKKKETPAPEAAAPVKAKNGAKAAAAPAAPAEKPAKAPKAPKAPKGEGEESKRRGRSSGFEGKRLVATPVPEGTRGADNRRHKTSRRTANRAIIQAAGAKGILFEDYLAKGGHPGDLARDVKKGATTVK